MRRASWLVAILLTGAVLLTGCRDPEASVHNQIRRDAEELAVAAADLAHRGGLRDHKAFETSLRTLPYATTRGYQGFRWEGETMHALVSFSSNIQKTEAEGAGRYSARSCADFTADLRSVKLVPADCPTDIPLEYGSSHVADYRLPEISRDVQSRW